ncbi:hypothetical protein [Sinorhizobium meliloti]|uniref:hypothetical protein n=1 Tax=Rhizobium meliloti TaxID=382 RepID=UPI000FD8654A|nr:hypothetical protein [Sinorhizobium meliloti]RVH04376.1 hypothetical protein CN210_17395 [Sinorhizobium meliloti]
MKRTWKDINWLWIAGVFTAAYAVAICFTLSGARIWDFLSTTNALNEVGDFLAGAFAPVALIWLVAAVLTQRQELNETRDQFAENQKVVDAQLKTINSQNSLLALQHNQAVENAKQAYRLSLFDKRLQIYEKFKGFGEVHQRKDYDEESYLAMVNLSQEAAFVFDRSFEDWLDEIAQQIHTYIQFKSENRFKDLTLSLGPEKHVYFEHNRKLEKQYGEFAAWIREQFLPEVRVSKFWQFMHVSDQPYMDG